MLNIKFKNKELSFWQIEMLAKEHKLNKYELLASAFNQEILHSREIELLKNFILSLRNISHVVKSQIFQDILDTGLESICNSLTDSLCSHFIVPILCSSMHRTRLNSGAIDFMGSNDPGGPSGPHDVGSLIALFLLSQCLSIFREERLLVILMKKFDMQILNYLIFI